MIFASPRRFGLAGDCIAWADPPAIAPPPFKRNEVAELMIGTPSPFFKFNGGAQYEAEQDRKRWWGEGMAG